MSIDLTLPDPAALAGMTPGFKKATAETFRGFADWYGERGDTERAHYFLTHASALEFGGVLDLSVLLEDRP